MNASSHTISASNGRKLRIMEAGRPEGTPILVHNGTPGSGFLYHRWLREAEERGMRLISYDRPGYGGSTPQPGRTIASAADDVATIARELDLSQLLVWGISGGGPHALACAALLPNLVVAAAAIASVAPYQADGLDWFAGMGESVVTEFRAALEGRQVLEQFVEAETPEMLNFTSTSLFEAFNSILSPVEVAALTEELAGYILDCAREGIQQSRDGWIDDDLAFVKPWGFELSQIQVPVLIMQGAQDNQVPSSHGDWLASRISSVETRLLPEDGHITLFAYGVPEVHTWLLRQM